MSDRLGITFGALAPKLSQQLAQFDLGRDDVRHWQKDADAIVRLAIRGLIPDNVKARAYQRLTDRIAECVRRAKNMRSGQ